ncbi:MAG: M23 family metallopeptidase [Gemmatimonadetes bacterium]|nr:M23 family metallopeptidase [Gemmatimonadota bacterium]
MRRGRPLLLLALLGACAGGGATREIVAPPTPAPVPRPARRDLPATPRHPEPLQPGITDDDLDALWARQLMVPVHGMAVADVTNTYPARRGRRIHGALDLLAPKGTPVVAADDSVIGRMYTSALGGIVIYAFDPAGRFVYYYAHLDRYRRGLAVGDRVSKGEVIGYVGTTGNAARTLPHLHFQVMTRGRGRSWWDGPYLNPYPYLALDGDRR